MQVCSTVMSAGVETAMPSTARWTMAAVTVSVPTRPSARPAEHS